MAGAELIGVEELQEIKELFSKEKVNLYRYGPNNYKTRQLEEEFAKYMGVSYAHAVSSGTAAIHSALAALGIGPGDEVITTAWTFVAPVEAIVALGAKPVLANIDETYSLDPSEVEKLINEKTKAVVSVPMWAAPKMDELIEICKRHSITMIEDAAQSLGAEYNGKKLGTLGEIGTFSFDAGKSLHVGEGGMVITNSKDLYEKVAEFSDHGHMHIPGLPRGKDPRRLPGLNYRMSELTAAVGIAQLNKIDYILQKAQENKQILKEQLNKIPGIEMRTFSDEKGSQGDTLIFSMHNSDAALKLEAVLSANGFGTKILPEAIDWHFAGSWGHILESFDAKEDIIKNYKKTGELLTRSICLNIPVIFEQDQINKLASIIKNHIG
tara:strand:+ start:2574 stop:3716 length:1143 start_codon:yes stop_codon:yes gene_type:complete